jgi:hypothetical protein
MVGRAPRPGEESIVATVESLVRLGLLKNGREKTIKSPPRSIE